MYVNTNINALSAIKQLNNTTSQLEISFERLSSGKRINSAADDAAGLQISNRLTTQINALERVDKNIADGISYAQVVEGALEEVTTMVQRMYQLAIQASNGSNSDSDKKALNQEFQELKQEIDRVSKDTQIFGQYPLAEENTAPLVTDINNFSMFPPHVNGGNHTGQTPDGINFLGIIPKGTRSYYLEVDSNTFDGDFQIFTKDGKHISGTPLSDATWTSNGINSVADLTEQFLTCKNGFNDGAIYDTSNAAFGNSVNNFNDAHIVASDDRDTNNDGVITAPEGGEDQLSITGLGIDDGTGEDLLVFTTVAASSPDNDIYQVILNKVAAPCFKVLISPSAIGDDGFIEFSKTPSSSSDLGIHCEDISTMDGAQTAISSLQNALNQIGEYRSHYGAKMNVLTSASRSTMNQHENLATARSRIQDTNYAEETAKLAKEQVLQQASQTVLSKANILPEIALSLLK